MEAVGDGAAAGDGKVEMGGPAPARGAGVLHPGPFLLEGEVRPDSGTVRLGDLVAPILAIDPEVERALRQGVEAGATGDDGGSGAGAKLVEGLALEASVGLSVGGKALARRRLDKIVEIDEGTAGFLGDAGTQGGFSGAAMADEGDGPQALPVGIEVEAFGGIVDHDLEEPGVCVRNL